MFVAKPEFWVKDGNSCPACKISTYQCSKKRFLTQITTLTTAEVNRNIAGDILHVTMKSDQIIDIREAKKYSLSLTPVGMCFPDGTIRSTATPAMLSFISHTHISDTGPIFFIYLFIYSVNKYKSPIYYIRINKFLYVCNTFRVFRFLLRTSITFKTKLFVTLAKG